MVINITAARVHLRGAGPALPFDTLHRYNDLARQTYLHEHGRELSSFEVHAVVYAPEQLGLGHGPFASRLLNPAI